MTPARSFHPSWTPRPAKVTPELFVAVLGASNYTYAEATLTQRSVDFIQSHTRTEAVLWRRLRGGRAGSTAHRRGGSAPV